MSSTSIRTDIDISNAFKGSVGVDYKTALEFITVYPDYSLIKFREILSYLCEVISDYSKAHLDFKKLWPRQILLA